MADDDGLSALEYIERMWARGATTWGPRPLPEFLTDQLIRHGFSVDDSGRIARQINEGTGEQSSTSLFVDLGSCKFLEGDVDGAIASWRHAISSDKDDAAAPALLNLGLLYEHLHLYDRALGLLAAVADRNIEPYVVPAAMASARCQVARGDSDQAMETMARLAQMTMTHHPDGPELIETLYGLGDVAEHAGRTDRAERSWRVAAASPPSAMQRAAADRLASLLSALGHDDELLSLIDAQAVGVVDPSHLVRRIEMACHAGDHDKAAGLIETVDGNELLPAVRFRLATCKAQCGQVNSAIDDLEHMLGAGDTEIELRATHTLGALYADHDMTDAAATMFERAIDANDRYWSPKAALSLGDLLADTGDPAAAIDPWRVAASGEIRLIAELATTRLTATAPTNAASIPQAAPAKPKPASAPSASPNPVAEPQVISLDAMEAVEAETIGANASSESSADDSAEVAGDRDVVEQAESTADEESSPIPEPVIVVLSSLEDEDASTNGEAPTADAGSTAVETVIDLSDESVVADADAQGEARPSAGEGEPEPAALAEPAPSAFASHLGPTEPENPYAALAPEGVAIGTPSPTRNPYAELAPNYDDDFDPPADVEPGDWESMLSDWPRDDDKPAKKRSSAFSRYT